jgi:hypothetical protein
MYNNLFIKPIIHNKVKQNNMLLNPMKLCDKIKIMRKSKWIFIRYSYTNGLAKQKLGVESLNN